MKRVAAFVLALTFSPSLVLGANYVDPHVNDFPRWDAKRKACERKYGHCSYIDAQDKFLPYCGGARIKGCYQMHSKPHLKNGLPYY